MKIVHIHQYYNDQMAYHENILPDYEASLGHEVIVLTSVLSNGFNGDERLKEARTYKDKGFLVKRLEVKGEFKSRFVWFKDLGHYLEDEKPDYIYHHSVTAPSLKVACAYKKQHPEVFLATDNHADWNISAKNKLWKLLYYNTYWTSVIKKCAPYIDVYFGVTPIRCLFLEEELGVPKEKIRLLPIGVDIKNNEVKLSKEALFEKHGLDAHCLTIIHGGKITPEKQIDRLVEAFMRLRQPHIRLVLFGVLKDEKVEALMKQDSRIHYIGWLNREETLAMLKYSDLGVWPTQHTTLLEDSIAVGLPMLLRYYGSTAHLINESGLFIYEGSIKEIQDRLNLLISQPQLLMEMKQKTETLRQLLSYEQVAKESIQYKEDLKAAKIHETFMSSNYTDYGYRYLRRFNRT